jgi:predicted dehydrogenase
MAHAKAVSIIYDAPRSKFPRVARSDRDTPIRKAHNATAGALRMARKPRIAVVGGGIYGTQMLNCFAACVRRDQLDLVALADLDRSILDRHQATFGVSAYADYADMFANVKLDAVAVATPDHLHADIIMSAANAGLHVISQKPLDTRTDRAKAIVEACRRKNVMLYVDFHKRFDPAHIRLKADIAAGKLGPIQYGHATMEDRILVPSVWLRKWAASSSPSWFLGIHFYDLVYWLLQSRPARVLATGHKGKLSSMGIDTWDSVQSRVEFMNGAVVSFDTSWILPDSFPSIVNQGLRLVGQNGIAEVDSQDRGMFTAYATESASAVVNPYAALEYTHGIWKAQLEGYTYRSMAYFVELLGALVNGESLAALRGSYPDGQSALVSTEMGEAIDNSLKRGGFVELSDSTPHVDA